jgi:uncharacterized protein
LSIRVTVVAVAPGLNGVASAIKNSSEISLVLPVNATIADALSEAGFTVPPEFAVGIWGKVRPLTFQLREDDRVEIYRPLQADPKAARRARDDGSTQKKRKA